MESNGSIVSKRDYPSPNPHIRLQEITYLSDGLKVKGLLPSLKLKGTMKASFTYVAACNISVWYDRRESPNLLHKVLFAPYYRGNRGGEGRDEFAGGDRSDAVYAV